MLLELGDMVYSSVPDLDNQKWNGRRVVTLIAIPSIHYWLFSGQRCHIGRGGNINSEICREKKMVN